MLWERGTVELFLAVGAINCVFLFLFAIGKYIVSRLRCDRHLKGALDELHMRVYEFEERYEILNEQTINYINSLSKEGVDALSDIQRTLDLLYAVLDELDCLYGQGDYHPVDEMCAYLRGECSELSANWTARSRAKAVQLQNWEMRLEDDIQCIGGQIAAASKQLNSVRIPILRKRKRTHHDLKAARIAAAMSDSGDRPRKTD